MSNPTNIRWDQDILSLKVHWDSVDPSYEYWVKMKYPEGSSGGFITTAGANVGWVNLDSGCITGNYTISIQSICDDVEQVNLGAFFAYRFYVEQPTDEHLTLSVNQTILQKPQNVRIESENILWDAVEYSKSYWITIANSEENGRSFISESAQLSLLDVCEQFDVSEFSAGNIKNDIFNIKIHAMGLDPVLESFENNHPVFSVYRYSDESDTTDKAAIGIRSIDTAENIELDTKGMQITWDAVPGASGYSVRFVTGHGSTGSRDGQDTSFSWSDNSIVKDALDNGEVTEIVIVAHANSIAVEDGFSTLWVSSVAVTAISPAS
jgi:hypothetical protein